MVPSRKGCLGGRKRFLAFTELDAGVIDDIPAWRRWGRRSNRRVGERQAGLRLQECANPFRGRLAQREHRDTRNITLTTAPATNRQQRQSTRTAAHGLLPPAAFWNSWMSCRIASRVLA